MIPHGREALLPCISHQLVLVRNKPTLYEIALQRFGSVALSSPFFIIMHVSLNSHFSDNFLDRFHFCGDPPKWWHPERNSAICGQPLWVPQGTAGEVAACTRNTSEAQDWVNVFSRPKHVFSLGETCGWPKTELLSECIASQQVPRPHRILGNWFFWSSAPHFALLWPRVLARWYFTVRVVADLYSHQL